MAETIAMVCVGCVVLFFAFLIGIKKKYVLMHRHQYHKVEEENLSIFCSIIGIGMAIIAFGMIMMAILFNFISETIAVTVFSVFLVLGLIVFLYAEFKYNHGIF